MPVLQSPRFPGPTSFSEVGSIAPDLVPYCKGNHIFICPSLQLCNRRVVAGRQSFLRRVGFWETYAPKKEGPPQGKGLDAEPSADAGVCMPQATASHSRVHAAVAPKSTVPAACLASMPPTAPPANRPSDWVVL